MPFRERLKKTFSRTSSTGASETSSLSKSATNGDGRKNSNVYQPGEKMPTPKYRRPVEKAHKERLEAFSFAKAWRRRSHQSVYSPMGSRIPSRAASVATGPSRNGSVVTATTGTTKSYQRGGSLDVPPDSRGEEVEEQEDKNDVEEVLSGASSSLESWSF